jgi:NAD(P)-dependent dehydrogenase (short-subunit alcohol dehydrogenase family)
MAELSLDQKVVIVTGGARGIGRGIARVLLQHGAKVTVAARTETDLDDAARELSTIGVVTAQKCDVADREQVERLVSETQQRYGPLDGLVCCHGVIAYTPFLELTDEQWDWTLGINLRGSFFCGRAAARAMVDSGRRGRIVFISSINGLAAEPNSADYSASKAGVHLLARGMACDLADRGITVNVVAPGWIRSPMSEPYLDDDVVSGRTRFNPVGRVGDPEDIGHAVAWLLQDGASYLTGAIVPVDGGQTAVLPMPTTVAMGD